MEGRNRESKELTNPEISHLTMGILLLLLWSILSFFQSSLLYLRNAVLAGAEVQSWLDLLLFSYVWQDFYTSMKSHRQIVQLIRIFDSNFKNSFISLFSEAFFPQNSSNVSTSYSSAGTLS